MLRRCLSARQFLRRVNTAIGILCTFSLFLSCGVAAENISKSLIVGAIGNFPPYFQIDSKGQPFGFAIDSAREITRILGLSVEFKTFKTGSESRKALIDGRIDVLPSLGITEPRKNILDFTVPIETFRIVYFVRSDSQDIKTTSDVFKHTIGVAKPNAANRILAKRKGIKRKVFSDTPSALFGLLSAQVDVVAYPEPVFKKLARDGGISDRFKVVGEPLIELKRGMAVRKGRTELLALLNRGVNDFIKSPEYRATYVRYFGKPPPFWTPERIALVMGLVLVGTAIIMAAWRYISMSQLNRKLTVTVQEREGIAEERRQSEHRFKDFADAASDWFWETDQNHKFTYVSQPYYDFTGFQPEERLGRTRQ